ncbi:hypothetical protein [Microbacterium sp. LWH10-1.2]|uniref:hypothetical protein n=1 Tax=Microbacterium sp. LWH10-1.2 TaxID=3135255 RepID=UPI0031386FBF
MSKLTAQDQAALARYLNILRDAGPGMDSRLVDAFEKLTPAQLDALVELTLEEEATVTTEERTAPAATRASTSSSKNAVAGPGAARIDAPHAEQPQEKGRGRWCAWFGDSWTWAWVLLLLE